MQTWEKRPPSAAEEIYIKFPGLIDNRSMINVAIHSFLDFLNYLSRIIKLNLRYYCYVYYVFYASLHLELVRFSNRSCRSCKTQPIYLLKLIWANLNNTLHLTPVYSLFFHISLYWLYVVFVLCRCHK